MDRVYYVVSGVVVVFLLLVVSYGYFGVENRFSVLERRGEVIMDSLELRYHRVKLRDSMLMLMLRDSEYRIEGYMEELRKSREDAELWFPSHDPNTTLTYLFLPFITPLFLDA